MPYQKQTAEACGLLISGGMDSGILLWRLLNLGRRVQPFYVRSGVVWEEAELAAVRALLESLESPRLESLVTFDMPLADLYGDHWSTTGRDTPDADSPDEAVYLPGRNALLALKPAIWSTMHGIEELALAVLRGNPFSDATAEFFCKYSEVISMATGQGVRLFRPFAHLEKNQVLEFAQGFPLELTFSCIAPVGRLHCGVCNKCAERQHAFQAADIQDPTVYNREIIHA